MRVVLRYAAALPDLVACEFSFVVVVAKIIAGNHLASEPAF